MDYKVEFTRSFLADLERIVRWVTEINPSAAAKLGEAIIARAEALRFFPERYPRVQQRSDLRRYIVARHFKVFYRIRSASLVVEVLCCWDGRRGTAPRIG